jgi:hypothetical protein
MQYVLTPQAGKRLIGKALAKRIMASEAFAKGSVLIVGGTTNGYLAEELSLAMGRGPFDKRRFFRGITTPPSVRTDGAGRLEGASFAGDILIDKGEWVEGKTIFDVTGSLRAGDIIVKGANAIDLSVRRGGVLIGHPEGGTVVAAIQAAIGRRARIIVAAGLEKRVEGSLDDIARLLNDPKTKGFRFMPIPGELYTEIDAILELSGAEARLVSAGGVAGAEGAVWLHLSGAEASLAAAKALLAEASAEPPFAL